MASNSQILAEDGDTPDWIELYNPGDQVLDLGNWFLTDDPGDLVKWRIPPGTVLAPGRYLVVFASGNDHTDPARELHTSFQLRREQGYLALVEPDGLTIADAFEYGTQFRDLSYGVSSSAGSIEQTLLLPEGAEARALIPENDDLGSDWRLPAFDDGAWPTGQTGIGYDYGALVGLDVGSMRYVNPSVYCRIPFDIESVLDLSQLTLRMKYEDGFTAYLNGVPVAAANAPEEGRLAWNVSATATRGDGDAVGFADFVLGPASLDALVSGRNILAIHGLNTNASSSDLLVLPELWAQRIIDTGPAGQALGYLVTATPGSVNGPVNGVLGPGIFDVTPSADPPVANQDLVITARVTPTAHAIAAVELTLLVDFTENFRRQGFNPAPMTDDGFGGDGAAGDGIYSVAIPRNLYQAGQMVRWTIVARDGAGNETRSPTLLPGVKSDEYHGTVVRDPAQQSPLPVIQWFVENISASERDSGTRGSVYFMDEFYDNVIIHRRGGSTAGAIKTHFKINFNPGHKFRFDPDEGRVNEINLNSPYSDKATLRQPLAFEAYDWCGCPGSLSFPIVGYRNGDFFGVQILIEEPEEELLQREGLDPDGALYKMYNQFTGGNGEKKTRRWEGNQDLSDFVSRINGSSGAERHNTIFDLVDLPRTLNYLAATVLVHQNDHPHKNHYLYRDSDGSGQWCFLPWDHDLTWGSNWIGSQGGSYSDVIYAANDQIAGRGSNVKPSHPFVGRQDAQEWNRHWNRLIDALLNDAEVREMYLRRLRTIMDEFLQPPGTPYADRFIERRIDELAALLAAEVARDYARWANPWRWGGQGGTPRDQSFAAALEILKTDYLDVRRHQLFVTHQAERAGVYNISGSYSARIPSAQPPDSVIEFGGLDVSPASKNQDEEYVELVNANPYAVDISGWRLVGAVRHTFLPGTVLSAGGRLYCSPEAGAFLKRTVSPKGGEGHFVQGDYRSHLSSWGETLTLLNRFDEEVASLTYEGMPNVQQRAIRISELMYHPADPPAGIVAHSEEFEFIELVNVGTETVDLSGLRFTAGIVYAFPERVLAPGSHVIVAKNPEVLSIAGGLPLAESLGPYDGQLANGGETLKLEDRDSNTILEFAYADDWISLTDGGGHSLVLVDPATIVPSAYSDKASWRASREMGGSPGG